MTTFSDREHAIESYYAAGELDAFRRRSRRYRRLGLRLAGLTDLKGRQVQLFAAWVGRQCVDAPSDDAAYRHIADELARMGAPLSREDIARIAAGGPPDWNALTERKHERSWVEFVTGELLAVFEMTPEPEMSSPHAGLAPAH